MLGWKRGLLGLGGQKGGALKRSGIWTTTEKRTEKHAKYESREKRF
jgi:hypothetical protein